MKRSRLGVLGIGCAALLAACGSSGTSSTGVSSSSTTAAASSSGSGPAKAALSAAEALPSWSPPGSKINMASLKGKNVWVITSSLAVPFVASIVDGVKQAAAIAGWKLTVIDGQGDVAKWNSSLEQAVSQHAAAVISVAASPEVMKTGMQAANAAHIPVIDVLTSGQNQALVPGNFAHVSISFYKSGELQADYVIAHSSGPTDVLVFGDNEFPGEVRRVQGMKHEFSKLCGSRCKVTVQDTQVGSLATQLPNLTQSLLRRNPNIKWVLPTYDAQAVYIVPAIQQMGLTSVKVVGSDAVPSNLTWVQQKHVEVADVGEPDVWTGWAAVDEAARAILNLPAVNEKIPLRMFVPSNLSGQNTSNQNKLFGGNYQSQFKTLWGLS